MFDRFEKFTVLINCIVRGIHKIKSEEMSKFGLKSTHVSCIYYLYREGEGLTAKELCDVCGEDKAAISRAIDFLERNGYITCESKFEKRYKSPILLTEKGIELGKAVSFKIGEILEKASSGLDEEKRKVLYEGLTLVCDNLQKLCEE